MSRLSVLMLAWASGVLLAGAQTVVRLGPETGTVISGGTIGVGIRAENVAGLHLAHLFLCYDSTVVRFEGASIGTLMAGAFFHQSKGVRSGSASLLLDAALLGGGASVSGSGTVCSIRFSGIRAGKSRLWCEDLQLLDTVNGALSCRVVDGAIEVEEPAGVDEAGSRRDQGASRWRCYPNPFLRFTTIEYRLAERSDVAFEFFDILGQKVAEVAGGSQEAGVHTFRVDASGLPSGEYFCRIRGAAGFPGAGVHAVKRLTVLR